MPLHRSNCFCPNQFNTIHRPCPTRDCEVSNSSSVSAPCKLQGPLGAPACPWSGRALSPPTSAGSAREEPARTSTSGPVPGSSRAGSLAGLGAPDPLGDNPSPTVMGHRTIQTSGLPPAAMTLTPGTGVTAFCRPAFCAVLGGQPEGSPAVPWGRSPSASLSRRRMGRPVRRRRRGRREGVSGCRRGPCRQVTAGDRTVSSSPHRARRRNSLSVPIVSRGSNARTSDQALRNGDQG